VGTLHKIISTVLKLQLGLIKETVVYQEIPGANPGQVFRRPVDPTVRRLTTVKVLYCRCVKE
jgi:hypothetical protein